MTIEESPIQIRYYTPGIDYARYVVPNISYTPWFTDSMIIVNGIYGHQNFNQMDFYDNDNGYINIRLLPSYKIEIYYINNNNWFEYNPSDPYEKFQDCFNFILSCYEHCQTLNTIDELE